MYEKFPFGVRISVDRSGPHEFAIPRQNHGGLRNGSGFGCTNGSSKRGKLAGVVLGGLQLKVAPIVVRLALTSWGTLKKGACCHASGVRREKPRRHGGTKHKAQSWQEDGRVVASF